MLGMFKINLENFSKEELKVFVAQSFDKTSFSQKLGFTYSNGKVIKKIDKLIIKFNLDISHFDKSAKVKARRVYPIVKKNCPVCDTEFETQTGNKEERTTCSYACSNKHFTSLRHSEESNKKRSDTLNVFHLKQGTAKILKIKKCDVCDKLFSTYKKLKKCCTGRCATFLKWKDPVYAENLKSKAIQRVLDGTHKGWVRHEKTTPSFPEKVTIELLDLLKISYLREVKAQGWYIDFADINRKIALEIDGKQHELPKQKASDERKDAWLLSQGWKVYRIKWRKITKEFRTELIEKLSTIFYID